MSYANGRITGNVSVDDVRHAIGEDSTDVGTLCGLAKNKWAKYKPVKTARTGILRQLTENEFRLTHSETIDGVTIETRYGLACTTASALSNIHKCTFDYFRPSVSTEQPARLTDYLGYVEYGTPEFVGVTYLDDDIVDPSVGTIHISLRMNLNSSGTLVASYNCVSLKDVMGYSDLSNVTNCYVCCMVSGTNGSASVNTGSNWMICCTNSYTSTITPIKSGSVLYEEFDAPLGSLSLPRGLKASGKHLVSFFLAESNFGWPASVTDWTSVDSTQIVSSNYIAIPDAAGLTATFATAADKIIVNGFNVTKRTTTSGTTISGGISFSFKIGDGGFTNGQSVSIRIYITGAGVTLLNTTQTYTVSSQQQTRLFFVSPETTSGGVTATATLYYESTSKTTKTTIVTQS